MNEETTETRSVTVERELPHPPGRIWRALTQSHLIGEWLMACEFAPEVGHRFQLRAEWGTIDGEVLAAEPERLLSYRWGDHDLDSVVTWTLEAVDGGTRVHMEQTGFRPDQPRYYHGAKGGWPRLFAALEQVLDRMD